MTQPINSALVISARFRIVSVLALSIALTGCESQMHLMPRDVGKIYLGSLSSNGFGGGTLSVTLDERTCSGQLVQSQSADTFGFIQTYGRRPVAASVFSATGSGTYKALLACTDGTGLRCDAEGATSGGGICVDSRSRVYDMIYM